MCADRSVWMERIIRGLTRFLYSKDSLERPYKTAKRENHNVNQMTYKQCAHIASK